MHVGAAVGQRLAPAAPAHVPQAARVLQPLQRLLWQRLRAAAGLATGIFKGRLDCTWPEAATVAVA